MLKLTSFSLTLVLTVIPLYAGESERIKVRVLEKVRLGTNEVALVPQRYFSSAPREEIPDDAATLVVLNAFETTKRWDRLYSDLLGRMTNTQLRALQSDAERYKPSETFPPIVSIKSMRFSTSDEIEITTETSLGRQVGKAVEISEIETKWIVKQFKGQYLFEIKKQSEIKSSGVMY